MPKRTRGAQPANRNAWKDGRHSAGRRAQRHAERAADAAERRTASDAWASLMPATDYASICDGIKATKEAFAGLPQGYDGVVAALKAGKDDGK